MKTIQKGIKLTPELIERIEQFQKDNYLSSLSEAMRILILKALENEGL